MPIATSRTDLIYRLRADVAAVHRPTRARDVLPFDILELDSRLGDGGLAPSLHEVAAASPDLAEDGAATLFIAGIAARLAANGAPVVWVLSRFDLYAPGLEQAGLGAGRVLFVEARDDPGVLAAMEDALRFGSLAAVVGEVRRVGTVATRRLQLAAAEHGTPALLFRRWRKLGACPLSEPSAAATRWRIGCTPSAARSHPGVNRPRWQVELVRQRNGAPFSLSLEASDATGRLALPTALTDRAVAPAQADPRAAARCA